jgi:hypothetical protein
LVTLPLSRLEWRVDPKRGKGLFGPHRNRCPAPTEPCPEMAQVKTGMPAGPLSWSPPAPSRPARPLSHSPNDGPRVDSSDLGRPRPAGPQHVRPLWLERVRVWLDLLLPLALLLQHLLPAPRLLPRGERRQLPGQRALRESGGPPSSGARHVWGPAPCVSARPGAARCRAVRAPHTHLFGFPRLQPLPRTALHIVAQAFSSAPKPL